MNTLTQEQYDKLPQRCKEDYMDFISEGGCCSCHISPPCSYCTHPGNPLGLEEYYE